MKAILCPRDAAPLQTHRHLRQPWYACQQCQGMFLPLSKRPELAPLLDQIAARASECARLNMACPQCERTLHLTHYQGVEIDLCLHCRSVWLDKGEADKINTKQTLREAKEEIKWNIGTQHALDWLGDALGAILRL